MANIAAEKPRKLVDEVATKMVDDSTSVLLVDLNPREVDREYFASTEALDSETFELIDWLASNGFRAGDIK